MKGKVGIACAVVGGVIKGVFKVDDWSYCPNTDGKRKIQFEGKPARKRCGTNILVSQLPAIGNGEISTLPKSLVQNRTKQAGRAP